MHTLVYIHGLGDDETAWRALWREPALSCTAHSAYVVPGMGDRPWSGERVEDVANDLGNYVTKLSEPVVLVGHSLGGAIATILAESPPANLRAVVNIEGNLTPADCGISGAAVQAVEFNEWFEQFIGAMPSRYAQALRRSDPRAFHAMAQDLVRLSDGMAGRYLALGVPKLVIYGTNGFAAVTQEWVVSAGVKSICVEGAGHWVQEDAPEETASAIRDFLEGSQPTVAGADGDGGGGANLWRT